MPSVLNSNWLRTLLECFSQRNSNSCGCLNKLAKDLVAGPAAEADLSFVGPVVCFVLLAVVAAPAAAVVVIVVVALINVPQAAKNQKQTHKSAATWAGRRPAGGGAK